MILYYMLFPKEELLTHLQQLPGDALRADGKADEDMTPVAGQQNACSRMDLLLYCSCSLL